nr:granulin a [Nothobranchius furzeri]
MQLWPVIFGAVLAQVGADVCPDAGRCKEGQTCCHSPTNGFECCPFDQAECCEDHIHCCPADTLCEPTNSRCVNATVSIPWAERASADQPQISKSFRMIKSYTGEDDDNVCADQSRCPSEFSCLKALTRYGCCPLAKGVSCPDGKHCCPEGHRCSNACRSCIKKDVAPIVLCDDDVSECPDGASCCENPDGMWGCCPVAKAVCCEDKLHCCTEGTVCDIKHRKCISESNAESPMWDKLPARLRADWENQKDGERVISKAAEHAELDKSPESTTVSSVPSFEKDGSVTAETDKSVPCNETAACPDDNTCCKTTTGDWACCPLLEAVCCEDKEHCCPAKTTCDLTTSACISGSDSTPMKQKIPALTETSSTVETTLQMTTPTQVVQVEEVSTPETEEKDEKEEEEKSMEGVKDRVPCDDHTSCPDDTTCCFIASLKKWGCCPLPKAVCCSDGAHCCPSDYQCDESQTSCIKNEVVIPWYTKIPATINVQAIPSSVQSKCPKLKSCCRLFTGEWGCCPLQNAVCCSDMEHCCPQGYTCDIISKSCQRVIMLEVETIPLTPVYQLEHHLQLTKHRDILCDDHIKCKDGETCCRASATSWGCCPSPNAVCCSDMKRCCPTGYRCAAEGTCSQNSGSNWHNWDFFHTNKKRALVL